MALCSFVFGKVISPETLTNNDSKNLTTTTERITNESTTLATQETVVKRLDLAFIMDSTGSMSAYIDNVRKHISSLVDQIVANSSVDLRVALIEYRDHVPQDSTFVTRKHDFTDSVTKMKSWLDAAQASGGGDGPEAVADALYQVTTLTWRADSAKISVLISDAPPHGLVPYEDSSFPNGSPNGHDPVEIVRQLAKREVTLYAVGCEPSIIPYKDFFIALAYLTGGQYIPLSDSRRLTDAIVGGAQEELSLQKFYKDVEQEIKRIQDSGGLVNETSITESVYQKLSGTGAKAKQLLRNNKPLEAASEGAKAIAVAQSMAEVRQTFKKKETPIGSIKGGVFYKDSVMYPETYPELPEGELTAASEGPGPGETYSAIDTGVSYEQISRLVKKKTAKLST